MERIYHYDASLNKCGVKCGTSLRFWENKGWINSIDPYGWFQWYFRYYLGRRTKDDQRQIKRWKGIVNRFKDILVKMIKDTGIKYDDYSVSPKIRQVLLHWGYELVKSDMERSALYVIDGLRLVVYFFISIKNELLLVQ